MTTKKYVPISVVCDKYTISPRAVRRYVAEGRITAHRVGPKLIRFDLDEVQAQLVQEGER